MLTRLAVLFIVLSELPFATAPAQITKAAIVQPPLFSASVSGRGLELHEFEQGSFGLFELSSSVDVEIHTDFDIRWVDIRPKSRKILPIVGADHTSLRFRVKEPGAVTVEFNDDLGHVVHLFAYAPQKDAPQPGTPNVLYFGPGIHEAGLIDLHDGETLYLAPGAWVKANIRSIGTKDVVIRGRGILDGSDVEKERAGDRSPGSHNMIYLEHTQNAKIEGITIFNSVNWTVFVRSSTGTRIDGVNILNPSNNYGNDGFDIVSSSDVVVENTFVRTNDDCVVVKNMDDVEVSDVLVRHSIFWNMPTGGNGIETGFELRNHPVHDLRFEDIDLIHVQRGSAISIHNGDSAVVENITFDNIRVEDVRRKLIDIAIVYAQYGADRPKDEQENRRRIDRGGAWDGILTYTPEQKPAISDLRGHIRNITIKNVNVIEGSLPYSVIAGFDDEHAIDGVSIEGLQYRGRHIRNAGECKLVTQYARGVSVR